MEASQERDAVKQVSLGWFATNRGINGSWSPMSWTYLPGSGVQQHLHTLLMPPKLCFQEELRILARATVDELKFATVHSRHLKARGIVAAIGAPMLWVGYLAMKHMKPRKSGCHAVRGSCGGCNLPGHSTEDCRELQRQRQQHQQQHQQQAHSFAT
jgi:hypothetical protein